MAKKKLKKLAQIFLNGILLTFTNPGHALSSQEITNSAPTILVGDKTLQLNGRATQYRFIFSIYRVELYLEVPSQDPSAILNSKSIKYAKMQFLRSVSADQIRESWKTEFQANCEASCALLNLKLDEILRSVPDMKEGESLEFTYLPDLFLIHKNGLSPIEVIGAEFGRIHLSTWLGANPPSERFKKNLLGL